MSSSFSELNSVEFFNFRNMSCQAKVIHSNDYNKNYVGLYKETKYINETGELKQSRNYVLYTIVAAEHLYARLGEIIEMQNNFQVCNDFKINSWIVVSY